MATATPEQIAANKKEFNMYCNDPAFGEKMTKEMNATWAQSDANGDGKLNKQEFLTFTKAMNAQLEARGCFADKRPEMFEKWWGLLERAQGGPDLTNEVFGAVMEIDFMKHMELDPPEQ